MELRWDPILTEWIIVSDERKKRPTLPEEFCPFCKESENITKMSQKVVFSLPNKFPALVPNPPSLLGYKNDKLYRCRSSKGICEVVIYTPQHNISMGHLSIKNIISIIELWSQRFKDLSKKDFIKFIFIFENKGRVLGVTLDHPHGQIYAFPFIPPLIKKELSSSKRYWKQNRSCLFCKIIEREKKDNIRLIYENEGFICFLPFFARWPYGVHIYSKRHIQAITDFTKDENELFAIILKKILTKFDHLFNTSFPYIMVLHQRPTNGNLYPYYHFHVEFYPPYREKDKIKYFAGVEMGTGTITFDYTPESKAKELRDAFSN